MVPVCVLRLVMCLVALVTASGAQQRGGRGEQVIRQESQNTTCHWSANTTSPAPNSTLAMEAVPREWRCNGSTNSIVVTTTGNMPEVQNKTTSRRLKYTVHEEPETWERAKSICEEENAHLLILNSQKEADEIIQLLNQYPNIRSGIPIGITDKEKEGEWKTIFGESLADAGYNIWPSVEPDGGTEENCVYATYQTMLYFDWLCNDRKTPFVCEKTS